MKLFRSMAIGMITAVAVFAGLVYLEILLDPHPENDTLQRYWASGQVAGNESVFDLSYSHDQDMGYDSFWCTPATPGIVHILSMRFKDLQIDSGQLSVGNAAITLVPINGASRPTWTGGEFETPATAAFFDMLGDGDAMTLSAHAADGWHTATDPLTEIAGPPNRSQPGIADNSPLQEFKNVCLAM